MKILQESIYKARRAIKTGLTFEVVIKHTLFLIIFLFTSFQASALSEIQFKRTIEKVQKIYSPLIQQLGAKLIIYPKWNDNTPNASYNRRMNNWEVFMLGGLARHPYITEDALALAICHELGHHLAGEPLQIDPLGQMNWVSAEGQSDYYATARCLKLVFAMDSNDLALKGLSIPKMVTDKCQKSFRRPLDQKICMRSAMASLDVAKFFADLEGVALPEFETPDELRVKVTNRSYPTAQCRLDTLFNGALAKDFNDQNDLRPACWLASKE